MARSVISLDDHFAAIKASLDNAPFPIGDGVAPRGTNKEEVDPPYAVLYLIGGGTLDGPLSDSQADASYMFQITAVGETRQQALVVLDISRSLMQRELISVPSRVVRDIRLASPTSGMVRDDDLPNPLFYGYDRYELDTTPA